MKEIGSKEVLPEYWGWMQELKEKYNSVERDSDMPETKGSKAFAGTLRLAMNKTFDASAVGSIYGALSAVVNRKDAGYTAWQMRIFIRRANVPMIKELGNLMQEIARVESGPIYISMDDLIWSGDIQSELEVLRDRIEDHNLPPQP